MNLDALHEDLYRIGNAASPSFSEQRGLSDCRVMDRNGIKVVLANGNGFSAFNYINQLMKSKGKNIWRIKKGAILPAEIRVVQDLRPNHKGHYMLAPAFDMPFKKYLGALEELGCDPNKAAKLTPEEIQNA